MIRTIIIGILILMLLVVLHEFGHFFVAKKSGVKVLEFGIGIPPKLFRFHKDKAGTEYTINAIPLGGFVRLKGEDPKDKEDFNAKDSLWQASLLKKILIISAGVVANLIVAWILFTIAFAVGTKPIRILPDNAFEKPIESYLFPSQSYAESQGLISGDLSAMPVVVKEIDEGGLAFDAGIRIEDTILSINEEAIDSQNISEILQDNIGEEILLKYQNTGGVVEQNIQCPDDQCVLGIALESNIKLLAVKMGVWKAMGAGWKEIRTETNLTFYSLGKIGKGLFSFNGKETKETMDKLTGPVGAIKLGEGIFQYDGIMGLIAFVGMISLALAIFNMLPIPALDGGRLLGFLIQAIFRIKKEKYFSVEGYINLIFFVLLMGLGVYIMVKDLSFWGVDIL